MKKILMSVLTLMFAITFQATVVAAPSKFVNYTVQSGDSMWKICNKFQIGVPEVITSNPQVSNPNNLNLGDVLKIPNLDDVKILENGVIKFVNSERAKVGVTALKANWQLSRVARYKADDMNYKKYFSHTSPSYGSPFNMIKSFGINFTAAGENIAEGQRSPEDVMKAWMNSSGHRENILNANYSEIGVGVSKDDTGTLYWVQQFIKR